MRLSFSSIESFEICPKKYEFQNIDKIKVPKSKEQLFGTVLHSCLKFFYEKSPIFPSLEGLLEYFRLLWIEASSKIQVSEQEKEIFLSEGKNIIENFYHKNQPFNSIIMALETKFEASLFDEESGESHVLAGTIDRIDKMDDGIFEIIDYKTNRRMPSSESVSSSLQLSVYALGFLSRWPDLTSVDSMVFSLYFLKHGEKISSKRTADDLNEVKKRIFQSVSEIRKNLFPPVPSALCRSCPYRRFCPMWSHLYKKDVPEEKEIKNVVNEYFALKEKDDQNSFALTKIKSQINSYLDKKGLERVFGDDGFIARSSQQRTDYDLEKIREILIKKNVWDKILIPDKKKLEMLAKSENVELKKIIENAKVPGKTIKVMRAIKKSPERLRMESEE